MKTFFRFVGFCLLVIVLACFVFGLYQNGMFDPRFWGRHEGWDDFQNGVYYCDRDLEAGSYDVIIRRTGCVGSWYVYASEADYLEHKWLSLDAGNLGGFHVSLEKGQVLSVRFDNPGAMLIRKC